MERRRYLAGLACSLLCGCLGGQPLSGPERSVSDPPRAPSRAESALVRAAERDAIPAIVDPDWSDVTVTVSNEFGTYDASLSLAPHEKVVGVVRRGRARGYPLRVLNYHEAVNDRFGGPLLVTYCPLCGSAVVADRLVDETVLSFGVSGLLQHDNLVLYDRETDSLWSQNAGAAIRGPLVGTELSLVPSTLTTWSEWRAAHPGGEVLLPPPHSNTVSGRVATRDYTLDPYGGYATNRQVGVSDRSFDDDRLHPKAQVLGVTHGGASRAYPLAVVTEARVVDDTVGGLPIVVASDGSTLVAYDRRVGGETLSFSPAENDEMAAGGSVWRVSTGEARDGPHAGMRLRRATDRPPLFWFSWLDSHPETTVSGAESANR
jgi:hypothetical protein